MKSLKETLGCLADLDLSEESGFWERLQNDAQAAQLQLEALQSRMLSVSQRLENGPRELQEAVSVTRAHATEALNRTPRDTDAAILNAGLRALSDLDILMGDLRFALLSGRQALAENTVQMFAYANSPFPAISQLGMAGSAQRLEAAQSLAGQAVAMIPGLGALPAIVELTKTISSYCSERHRIADAVHKLRDIAACRWYLDHLAADGIPQIEAAVIHTESEGAKIDTLLTLGVDLHRRVRSSLPTPA